MRSKFRQSIHFCLLIYISVVLTTACSKAIRLGDMHRVAVLPDNVHETSGLVYYNGFVFTMNDGGNAASIYGFEQGKYSSNTEIQVASAQNIDWEEIALFDSSLVVADIGNNFNTRDTFNLYFIPIQSIANQSTTNTEQIRLHITNTEPQATHMIQNDRTFQNIQTPPPASQPHKITFSLPEKPAADTLMQRSEYDMEAAMQIGSKFFVFTKNWKTEVSLIYEVSCTNSGKARLCDTLPFTGLVTAACPLPDSLLAFVGYHSYIPFVAICKWNYQGLYLVSIKRFWEHWACQTEGLCYIPGYGLLISAEETSLRRQALYRVKLKNLKDIDK